MYSESSMFPERFIRGVPNKDFLDDGRPSSRLLFFKKMDEGKDSHLRPVRADGYHEESITWYDNKEALDTVLCQRKDTRIQFQAGAAIFSRRKLDILTNLSSIEKQYTYERSPIDGNEYHGNLLCHSSITPKEMKQMAGAIAFICFEGIIEQNSN